MRRARTPRLIARAVISMAVAAIAVCGCSDSSASTSVGSVRFAAADGTDTTISSFKGTPLVVNLWATYCGPCVKEMPAIDSVATMLAGQVQIIGVNVFDSPENAAAFATDLGVSYPQFTDPDGRLSTALSVTGLPATAFFGPDGTLLDVHQGAYTADELRAAIEQQFSPISPAPEGTSS